MIKISKQDWERFKRDNNPEVFEAKAIDSWIENNRDLLVKAEISELEGIEKEAVDNFRTELSHFTKVEVMGPNPDKLQKGLYYETFYIREQQIEWDETIEKSEDGEDYGFGTFRKTALNDKLGRTGNLIEKGKRGQLGEIREWKGGKYKKTAQGWAPVSEGKKDQPSKEGSDETYEKERSQAHIDSIKRTIKTLEDRQKTHKLSEVELNTLNSHKKDLDKLLKNSKTSSEDKDDKKDSSGKVKSEYHIQYKDKWGGVRQKPFVATSIEEAIKMAKEQKIGSDISPSKIPDKTGREEKDQYIKEMESKKESEGKDDKKERNLWIADRAEKLAKDHPDKSNDQLLHMAGKEWESKDKKSSTDKEPEGKREHKVGKLS